MKKTYIVANWKSNKNKSEVISFLQEFKNHYSKSENKEVIFCPTFVYLQLFSDYIKDNSLDIKLGAQNVSRFEGGSFTGEVSAKQLKDFVTYCIVGHSERRLEFLEEPMVINDKILRLKEEGIIPIFCISDLKDLNLLNLNNCIVAYEPPYAIGTGTPEDPTLAEKFGKEIKQKGLTALYGASVNSSNVASFTTLESIDGVLVGTDSLDPHKFIEIINNA